MDLVLSAAHVQQLRDHLFQPDDLERVAVAYCSTAQADEEDRTRLLVTEIHPVADGDLIKQGQTACRPDPAVEREMLAKCRHQGMHPLVVHSHPFTDQPVFSTSDEDLMDGYQQWLTGLYPDMYVAFAVLGTVGIVTTVYTPGKDRFVDLPVAVIGDWTLDSRLETLRSDVGSLSGDAETGIQSATDATVPDSAAIDSVQGSVDRKRYDRSIRAITEQGQRALGETHIAIIGVGGLGSLMAEELARYGVRNLTLVDPDVVEPSNLPRLFGCADRHIGQPKVRAAREHLERINAAVDVTTVQARAEDAQDALKQCDLLVGGVDQMSARLWLNQFAVRQLLPYIDAGVVIDTEHSGEGQQPADRSEDEVEETRRIASMEGYIQCIVPGVTACFDCLDRGDPELARIERLSSEERAEELDRGYITESDLAPEPAVVPLNGIIASKTVQLVAKYVTGYAAPESFLRVELLENDLVELHTQPSDRCITCGHNGILGRGDHTDPETTPGRIDDTRLDLSINRITE